MHENIFFIVGNTAYNFNNIDWKPKKFVCVCVWFSVLIVKVIQKFHAEIIHNRFIMLVIFYCRLVYIEGHSDVETLECST